MNRMEELRKQLAEYQAKVEKINSIDSSLVMVQDRLKSAKESYNNYIDSQNEVIRAIVAMGINCPEKVFGKDKMSLRDMVVDYISDLKRSGDSYKMDEILSVILEKLGI